MYGNRMVEKMEKPLGKYSFKIATVYYNFFTQSPNRRYKTFLNISNEKKPFEQRSVNICVIC